MEAKRYNPMNDVLFKFIFGKEERKHITIGLINSILDRDKAHEIVDIMYGIYNPVSQHRLTEDMELHFFEIPKFRKKTAGEMTRAEKWLAYFANQLDEQEAEVMGAEAIKDAFSAADLFMQSEEQRLAYINREMAIMDYQSDMNASREEGRKEGANSASISIAKNMMSMGISPDIIYEATGVNLQEPAE